ncbi:hypothetical protein K438DRAFT_2062900 [Mycena galopus ATCC 62051]|nr:hypothetical protein K438DRAFT_2062900 [Mycena galopus ATCC 62051]
MTKSCMRLCAALHNLSIKSDRDEIVTVGARHRGNDTDRDRTPNIIDGSHDPCLSREVQLETRIMTGQKQTPGRSVDLGSTSSQNNQKSTKPRSEWTYRGGTRPRALVPRREPLLSAHGVLFRVFKGILAAHSPVFEMLDGCPVLRLDDSAADTMY